MDSKEAGLVIMQKLLGIEDLHYGYWDADMAAADLTIPNFFEAQARYSEVLFAQIESLTGGDKTARLLDVGCGVGENIKKLEAKGYKVEGVIPSAYMVEKCREKTTSAIHLCRFEDFTPPANKYDVVFFSESFQYVDMAAAFKLLDAILAPGGKVVIFDFFARDGVPGKSPLGGGHSLAKFDATVAASAFEVVSNTDVTANLAPNLDLVHSVVHERLVPSAHMLHLMLSAKHPFWYQCFSFLARKKLQKIKRKYTERNAENFAKYKSYQLMTLARRG